MDVRVFWVLMRVKSETIFSFAVPELILHRSWQTVQSLPVRICAIILSRGIFILIILLKSGNQNMALFRDKSWTKTGICSDCDFYKYCEGNGMHLRDEKTGELLFCHLKRIAEGETIPKDRTENAKSR